MRKAYFAGGCFWCITPIFRDKEGVLDVVSGYCGGKEKDPTYEQVKKQLTSHRETIMAEYDERVSYKELLDIFISNVDPYDDGGQFIDRGHSYTLAIYYTDEEEKELAERCIEELERQSGKKAYIAIEPFEVFYEAEEYHQNYDLKNAEAFKEELIKSGRVK